MSVPPPNCATLHLPGYMLINGLHRKCDHNREIFLLRMPPSPIKPSSSSTPALSKHFTLPQTRRTERPMPHKAQKINASNISPNDVIIAVMGVTGAGKITFINAAANTSAATVSRRLASCTKKVEAYRCHDPNGQRSVVLVDTPGFDDTEKSDEEILRMISDWLLKTYKRNVKLAGIIYLHSLTFNRMQGAATKNQHLFQRLCGEEYSRNVVVATTMWRMVKQEAAEKRERELHERFWKPMLELGSATAQFRDTCESAWSVIDSIVSKSPATLQVQKEMEELHKRLSETSVGMALWQSLVQSLQQRARLDGEMDETLYAKLAREEHQRLCKVLDEIHRRFPLGRSILTLLIFRLFCKA